MATITIEYCKPCNYEPKAASVALRIKEELGVLPQLVSGSGGVFEVRLDDQLVFSKKATGEFPNPTKLIEMLRQRLAEEER
ncbi:MAG: Rdx family protein [Myxococcales bacterium]|nr:Rdx family protein [Myxococcales bacterium]